MDIVKARAVGASIIIGGSPQKNQWEYIATLFLFPVTINLLLSCYLVYTARTWSRTQPCRVQGRVDGLLRT